MSRCCGRRSGSAPGCSPRTWNGPRRCRQRRGAERPGSGEDLRGAAWNAAARCKEQGRKGRSACVDAAQIARENINFWRVIERVLVSGLRSAALQAPRAGMVMRGSGPNLAPELEVPSRTLVFPILINRSFFHSVSVFLHSPAYRCFKPPAVKRLLPSDLDNLRSWSAWPRCHGPSCWRAP